jgi:hypothetical protein
MAADPEKSFIRRLKLKFPEPCQHFPASIQVQGNDAGREVRSSSRRVQPVCFHGSSLPKL